MSLFPPTAFDKVIEISDVFLIDCGGSNPIEVDDSRDFQPDSSIPNVKFSPSSDIVVSGDEMSISGNSALYNSARVLQKLQPILLELSRLAAIG
ncbi:hypothetical protein CRYUN_Cryun09bG0093700 [Craigia yunnanensis]